jgi:hypothetical protein
MKISIDILSHGIGEQLFDCWYAYRQGLHDDYVNDLKVVDYKDADFRLLFDYMPAKRLDTSRHDMIFICNGGEPCFVSSPTIKDMLDDPNIYLISNTYHHRSTHLGDKNVWYPHNAQLCHDYWTRCFYPQFHENFDLVTKTTKKSLVAFIGENRTWRKFFFDKLSDRLPDIDIKGFGAQDPRPSLTLDSQWESEEDRRFRDFVNDIYAEQICTQREPDPSFEMEVGINSRFGIVSKGYRVAAEYFENRCIIFPETDWQNDFLVMTEKSLKCFFSGSLPFPISGSGVNSLYNEIGFFTAWNLLPEDLKLFDSIKNHELRYEKCLDAIEWLYHNDHVFVSDEAKYYVEQNKKKFLSCESMNKSAKMFDEFFRDRTKS